MIDNPKPMGNMDIYWTGDTTDRKQQTSRQLFFMGMGQSARPEEKQETVAISSMKAGFVSEAEACKQLRWIQDFGMKEPRPEMHKACTNQRN